MKHSVFQFLPGRVGLRNRACLHQLTKPCAKASFEMALDSIAAGDICIDCGANVGYISGKFAARGARTYSFEPDPWSFQNLEKNLASFSNASLFNKAVGAQAGEINFYRDRDFLSEPDLHSLASSTFRRPDREQVCVSVEVIDILDFIKNLKADVKILKMDVEGSEVAILDRLLAEDMMGKIDYVFVETHELQFPDLLEPTENIRKKIRDLQLGNINLDWH